MPVMKDPHQQEIIQLNAQRVRDELAKYKMPDIRVGRQVRWSPVADFSYGNTVLGWVDKVENNMVNLSLMGAGYSGISMQEVPHISDPRLGLNSDWKANGAWDYAEDEADPQVSIDRLSGENKRLTERVKGLELTLKEVVARLDEQDAQMTALQAWADTLGIEEPFGPAGPPAKPAANPKK